MCLCTQLFPGIGQVWETDTGTLRSVLAAIKRGRQMRCTHCGHRGATLGCRVPSCNCRHAAPAAAVSCAVQSAAGAAAGAAAASSLAVHLLRRAGQTASGLQNATGEPSETHRRSAPPCSYHVACAGDAGCTYYCEDYLVACPDHAPQFKAQAAQQPRRTPFTPYRGAAAHAAEDGGGGGTAPATTPGGAQGDVDDLVSPPLQLPLTLL